MKVESEARPGGFMGTSLKSWQCGCIVLVAPPERTPRGEPRPVGMRWVVGTATGRHRSAVLGARCWVQGCRVQGCRVRDAASEVAADLMRNDVGCLYVPTPALSLTPTERAVCDGHERERLRTHSFFASSTRRHAVALA